MKKFRKLSPYLFILAVAVGLTYLLFLRAKPAPEPPTVPPTYVQPDKHVPQVNPTPQIPPGAKG